MRKLALFTFILLFVYACEQNESPYPPLKINKIGEVDSVSRACATAFVLDNQAYLLMGRKFGEEYLKSVYSYNPTTNIWTRKKDFPGKTRLFPVSAVAGKIAYAGLGYYGAPNTNAVLIDSAYLRDWWMYDQSNDTWTRKADFPEIFTNHAVSFVFNDEIYVAHGFGLANFSGVIYKYNPIQNQWIKLNNFPGFVRSCAVGCSNGERFFSGTGFASWNENDWWEYKPASDEWKKLRKMPDKGRINATAFSISKRIFVATGRFFRGDHDGGHLKNDILEYDINTNQWYKAGEINNGSRENSISFVIQNKAYIAFGEDEAGIKHDIWSIETQ